MPTPTPRIQLQTSPHLRAAVSVPVIMRNVVWALLPISAFAVWEFGLSAMALILVVTGSAVAAERLANHLAGKPSSLGDWSATISGLLLALTLPPGFPLWMGAVAGFLGIVIAKSIFGGLGFNVFNPALVGRAFVQAAFPGAITTWVPPMAPDRFTSFIPTTWTAPFMAPAPITDWIASLGLDSWSGATPLALWKFQHTPTEVGSLFTGITAGSTGETSALLILLCGAYLAVRQMMDWRIPAAMLLGAYLTTLPFYLWDPTRFPDPVFMLFSGGLMLGAVFMASDMVGSPMTPVGIWLYGLMLGLLTVMIRLFGGLPEGVMYAILLGNALSPMFDRWTQPRVYGNASFRSKGGQP